MKSCTHVESPYLLSQDPGEAQCSAAGRRCGAASSMQGWCSQAFAEGQWSLWGEEPTDNGAAVATGFC